MAESLSEADTCRKFVVPKLLAAGWDSDPHSIAEQRTITDGRIVPVGQRFVRKPPKRVDYLLRYTRDFPLAVVEAKAGYKIRGRRPAAGQELRRNARPEIRLRDQRARDHRDSTTSRARNSALPDFPTPAELWQRYQAGSGI